MYRPMSKTDSLIMSLSIFAISSEMSEVLRVSDRIAVLRDRQKVGEIDGKTADEQRVFRMIAGAEA